MLNFAGFAVEFIIVAVIVILQFYYFGANVRKRKQLKSIFPDDIDTHFSAEQNEEGVTQIAIENIDNELLTDEIIDPINSYLDKNKGATDYHIIKDLTDRACDKVQDEVDSYNPVPLYLGLCGPMLGIIMGIFFLWLSGGLDSLLASNIIKEGMDAAAINAAEEAARASASNGIQHLLGGVAIAMFASLCGVILTVIGTHQTKDAVASNEAGRNKFLSWVQTNLLPRMSGDVVSTLGVFYTNLNKFNRTFSQNSRELKSAFEEIQNAYAKYYYPYYKKQPGKLSEYTEEQAAARAAVAEKYGFTDTRYLLFHRVRTLSAAEYRMLISTYSDHITIEESVRERFFGAVEDAINRHGGSVRIFDTLDLQLARKL